LQRGVLAAAERTGALLVSLENLYGYGPAGGRPMTEDLPLAATTVKGRTRAAMTAELLAAAEAGRVRIAIGRASDFFGAGVTQGSTLGERVFGNALAGRRADFIGNPDLAHTYSYVPDIAVGLATLGTDPRAVGEVWHLPGPPTVTTRALLDLVAAHLDRYPPSRPGHPGQLSYGGLRVRGVLDRVVSGHHVERRVVVLQLLDVAHPQVRIGQPAARHIEQRGRGVQAADPCALLRGQPQRQSGTAARVQQAQAGQRGQCRQHRQVDRAQHRLDDLGPVIRASTPQLPLNSGRSHHDLLTVGFLPPSLGRESWRAHRANP
jgi:hypothetical protein